MESLTNLECFLKLKGSGSLKNSEVLLNFLKTVLPLQVSENHGDDLKSFCATYTYNLQRKWQKSGSKGSVFLKHHCDWLDSVISWPNYVINNSVINVCDATDPDISRPSTSMTTPTKSVGTSTLVSPRKPFDDIGPKQKKRRTQHLNANTIEELTFAQSTKLKESGNEDIAKIVDYLVKNPLEVKRVKDFIFSKKSQKMSQEKALSTILSLKMSKWQYNTLRTIIQTENIDLFPSYYSIQNAKKECYPPENDIIITETSARIKLQALLDLTANRLLKDIKIKDEYTKLTLESKWGFDGSSNQSNYKQSFSAQYDDDSSIFMASLVPIRLISEDQMIWENEAPSSTYYCRPIFFKFMKETSFNVGNEKNSMDSEIENLTDTLTAGGKTISHSLNLTMIDGKITSLLSGTSTQRCDICKAKPKEMNNLELIAAKEFNTDVYKYGLSSLHAWIRFMECILHISYRLEFKTWISSGENKKKMKAKKLQVQNGFKRETGLLIDVVKQGHGTSNDGNTARRFFANPTVTARITGVDENLIRQFSVLLETLSSGYAIDSQKFKEFADQTIQIYIENYSWYYMPASVHKILVHGKDIIENFGLLPIGKLSEDAAESRNKDFRTYRQYHARKFSRRATNEDIMNSLILTSDPHLSLNRHKFHRKHKILSTAAKSLLKIDDLQHDEVEVTEESFIFVDVNVFHESE